MTDAIFAAAGESRWQATALARGPWDPRHCHGGPVAALLGRAVERLDPGAWHVARLTTELMRPIPVDATVELRAEIERSGRNVSLVAVHMMSGDKELARARALRIRIDDTALPEGTVHADDEPPGTPTDPGGVRPTWRRSFHSDDVAYHSHATEHVVTSGDYATPGPVGVWIRLTVPLVPDEVPTGLQRVAAVADFGNGVSAGITDQRSTFINPDLTIHLARPAAGEWIGLWASTHYGGAGFVGSAYAESRLFDERGQVGRGVQSLLVTRLPD